MNRTVILRSLIDDKFGGSQVDFARAIGRSPSQVGQWLGGHRKLGDAGARIIELALKLPSGYFDAPVTTLRSARASYQTNPTPEADADALVCAQIFSLIDSTDHNGHLLALGAIRAALASHPTGKPPKDD